MQAPTVGCSTLVPEGWWDETPTAILGASDDEAERWQVYGIEQTGQLGIANAEKLGALQIIQKCEERDAATVRHINRPWWQRLF